MAIDGTQGAGTEGRGGDVEAEELIAERVYGAQERFQGGELAARGEGGISRKGKGTGWDGAIQPRAVVRARQGGRGTQSFAEVRVVVANVERQDLCGREQGG